MNGKTITITGGSGFVGRILRENLTAHGYNVVVFDRMRGPAVDLLRRRHFGTSTGVVPTGLAILSRRTLALTEQVLVKARAVRPSPDDILDPVDRLAARFRGSHAVIHLAGLPHPRVRGATEADFRRLNYDGAVNVFEAARAAGVSRFIFASTAQVYGINKPVRVDQFPILETNYCPTLDEGQSVYGALKRDFELYLEDHAGQDIQVVSLRLEFPGVRSHYPWNFFIGTSIENLIRGFSAAIEAALNRGFEVFNLADRHVDPSIVDVQAFLTKRWPQVPNYTTGNESLLSTHKASALLGYEPKPGGTYFSRFVMW